MVWEKPVRRSFLNVIQAAAITCLSILLMKVVPFHVVISIMTAIANRRSKAASLQRLDAATAVVGDASRWLPFRLACLERSLSIFLFLSSQGLGCIWHIGWKSPPLALHAWVTTREGCASSSEFEADSYEDIITCPPCHEQSLFQWR